jgi:lysophospholipase L1-like esterase
MGMHHRIGILAFLILFSSGVAQSYPVFKSNERVAFIGDSITHGGMYLPYIQTFYTTRFPNQNVRLFNLGIAGDTAKGGWERCSLREEGLWESDVRSYRPTAAVIMFGMNDASSSIFSLSQSVDELEQKIRQRIGWFKDSYGRMLDQLQALEIDSIGLITSSLYDQMIDPSARENIMLYGVGKNDLIRRMSREVIDVEAAQHNLARIDFNTPMDELNRRQQILDPAFSIIGSDRVHPGASGHMVMAYLFLKAQSLEGAVAQVEVDTERREFSSVFNSSVKELEVKKGQGLRFNYRANSLPFPPILYQPVDDLIPFDQEFNQERLIVKGLRAGRYALKMDEVLLGCFTANEWMSGINLAQFEDAPQVRQAQEVWQMCQERSRLASITRNIVWSDNQLRKVDGLERSNLDACKSEVARMLETDGSLTPYMKRVLQDYIVYVDQYQILRDKMNVLADQMVDQAQPTWRSIDLILVDEAF